MKTRLCSLLPKNINKICLGPHKLDPLVENILIKADILDVSLILESNNYAAGALWIVPDNNRVNKYNVSIFLQQKQKLQLKIFLVPTSNNFRIDVKIKAVLFDSSTLDIQTDLIVKQALGGPTFLVDPVYKILKKQNVTKGYINISEHILFFDSAVVSSVPEYSILPGEITQIHGMVIYGYEDYQRYFLNSRGINNIKELFVCNK